MIEDGMVLRLMKGTPYSASLARRFWVKVRKGPGCWLWKAGCGTRGEYGAFTVSKEEGTRGAHIIAWELANGRQIRPGFLACHTCDVGLCCRPDHLYEGTYKTNALDRCARGRSNTSVGENHHAARLTERKVRAIRKMYRHGVRGLGYSAIGKHFKVNWQTVCKIVKRERWAHVD